MQKDTYFQSLSQWTGLCVLALFLTASSTSSLVGQDTVDLAVEFAKGKQTRITCDVSHSGSVIIKGEDQDKVHSLPMDLDAKLAFFQLVNGADQAIRFYESANAKIKIDKGTTTPTLDSSNKLIVARLKTAPGELVELASMSGTLEQQELELLQASADPLTLADMFTKNDVKEGDKWDADKSALAKMLRVNNITESNVQLLLKKLDKNSARVYLLGTITADVDDVTTQMEVSGIAIIDVKTKSLSSLKLGIRETRGPGQITPGFEGKTKIDLRVASQSTQQLSGASLAKYTKNRKISQQLKWESPSNFVVNFEPRWKMINAEPDAAVLRYIDKNDLMAQCNIVQLPSRPAAKPLSLEAYKKEVAKIVAGDESARMVSAEKVATSADKTALRVIIAGVEEDLPVNWFYFHVSARDGRQMTFVFTLAESESNRVSTLATRLVNDFEFKPLPKKVANSVTGETQAKAKNGTSRQR